MKPALIIGSTCVDLILNIEHLPHTAEDIHPSAQTMSIGGCAYNVAHMLRLLQAEHTFISPVGGGIFGDYTRKHLQSQNIPISIYLPEQESGCCYCLVEKNGERTFLSYHGVEYTFQEQWMDAYPARNYHYTYICGLEIEEPTGENLVNYLEKNPSLEVCFAPGPRGKFIEKNRLNRIFALQPILHINEQEASDLSGCKDYAVAAHHLQKLTHNTIIITLGAKGAYCLEKNGTDYLIPAVPVSHIIDTIGAGDSHIGTILGCLTMGMTLKDAIFYANKVSAAVLTVKGGSLPPEKLPPMQ